MTTFVTRFAPSPTGPPHLGHAFSALTAFAAARDAGGRFLLRIEDIDTLRCRPEHEAAFLEDLAWLGLVWERPVRRQSEHLADYRAALDSLAARGVLYRCFRTRQEVALDIGRAPHGPASAFVGAPLSPDEEARRLAQGEPFAWRLSLEAARRELGGFEALTVQEDGLEPVTARPEDAGDIILARKDLGVAYHLAVVVDDAAQEVTHVIRGEDLAASAHIQRLIQALLDLPPPVYRRHRLIAGPDGRRLAKRDRAEPLSALRARGVAADQLRRDLGF